MSPLQTNINEKSENIDNRVYASQIYMKSKFFEQKYRSQSATTAETSRLINRDEHRLSSYHGKGFSLPTFFSHFVGVVK